MRVYALLLGVVLTTAYGYAAQVAVSSASGGRHPDGAPAPAAAAAPDALLDRIWYGGVIDPITVESNGGPARTTVSKRLLLDRGARCSQVGQPGYRAVS